MLILSNGTKVNFWQPRNGLARLYFSDKSFIQITCTPRTDNVISKIEGDLASEYADEVKLNLKNLLV